MVLCKKIRLKISKEGILVLEFMQAKCRGLYNWWIGKLRKGEQWKLYEISEKDTSKTCHRCSYKQDMPLRKRTYKCPKCSLKMGKDENSARNILLRFIARLSPHRLSQVCGVLGVTQEIDTFTHV